MNEATPPDRPELPPDRRLVDAVDRLIVEMTGDAPLNDESSWKVVDELTRKAVDLSTPGVVLLRSGWALVPTIVGGLDFYPTRNLDVEEYDSYEQRMLAIAAIALSGRKPEVGEAAELLGLIRIATDATEEEAHRILRSFGTVGCQIEAPASMDVFCMLLVDMLDGQRQPPRARYERLGNKWLDSTLPGPGRD